VAALVSPRLTNRAAAAGINLPSTPSWDVQTVDYDNDGDQDFSVSLHMKNAGQLLSSNGVSGTFTRVASTVMPRPNPQGGLVDRHACAWADFDHNERQDMYCSAGRYASNRYKTEAINNELWMQGSDGTFSDVATARGVGEPCTRGRHVVALDLNNDGWQDLFVGAQKERSDRDDQCNREPTYPYIEQSKVYINRGAGAGGAWLGFRAAQEWNVSQANVGNRLALSWDYNHDGRVDLLSMTFASRAAYVYRNTGTGFVQVTAASVGLPAFNAATLADLTGDGRLDFVFADNAGVGYRAGTATGVSTTTVRIGMVPTGIGWGVAVGDINGDGQLDVYGQVASSTATGNPADFVYVRQGASWQAHEVPAAAGDANDVGAVQVNGRAQFVVLNGGNDESESAGPVQLIAWVD
jgi:hypothetical protein